MAIIKQQLVNKNIINLAVNPGHNEFIVMNEREEID